MIQREVTVGRAPDSDILYGPECVHVSNLHGMIYSQDNQLIYKDMSTNGTLVNNRQVHHQSIAISYGDCILLAGRYPLTWDRIQIFFPMGWNVSPGNTGKTVVNPEYQSRQPSVGNNPFSGDMPFQTKTAAATVEVEVTRFNWGAFFLYPFWGFANGMWWAFLIGLLFGWTIIPNFLFGVMGSKWAWQNKQWRDLNHFVTVQNSWKKWGIALFLLNLFLWLICFVVIVALASVY